MTDFVSNRWMRVVATAAPMSIVWLVFVLHGSPWGGLVWAGLAFSAALWPRWAMPAPKPALASKGQGRR